MRTRFEELLSACNPVLPTCQIQGEFGKRPRGQTLSLPVAPESVSHDLTLPATARSVCNSCNDSATGCQPNPRMRPRRHAPAPNVRSEAVARGSICPGSGAAAGPSAGTGSDLVPPLELAGVLAHGDLKTPPVQRLDPARANWRGFWCLVT
jgi:hypothetical protein